MSDIHVTMSALRQRLGDLVNRAAYGDERIILVSRGQARAAIIGMADMERLQELDKAADTVETQDYLAAVTDVRDRLRAWQEANGIEPGDIVADLRQLREERDAQLSGMR